MELNHSFHFAAARDVLESFLEHLHNAHFTDSDIDQYEEEFQSQDKLVVFFDSYGSKKEFINKIKREAKKFNVDFDCSMINGWSLHGDYTIFCYRHKDNSLKTFELLPEHKQQVTVIDENTYQFLGVNYSDSDVPGVLGPEMIKHFYRDTFEELPQ